MCRTYNTIGSLASLKSHLKDNSILEFNSIKEVIDFQRSFETTRLRLISSYENLIKEEENLLKLELQELDSAIEMQKQQSKQRLSGEIDKLKQLLINSIEMAPTNLFLKLPGIFRQMNLKRQIQYKEVNFNLNVRRSVDKLESTQRIKNKRYHFITAQFDEAVKESARKDLSELDRKKTVIDEVNSLIYGALGEHKVAKKLKALPDEYILINDFAVSLSPPIYNSQEDEYIKSIQVDHLLVAPSGIFVIETKNWSESSLKNLSLRSPVQQIKRTSFVLFMMLNNEMSNYRLKLNSHHWGNKKISIKNLIVMTKIKPKEEFQYAKVLTLDELLGYVNYFKPIFSETETQGIADFLLMVNDRKMIITK